MSTNWKQIVSTNNAKTFVLPEGWDSRETVAATLECSTDRVRILLAPAIKAGEVEVKIFPVWDKITRRNVQTTAYRRRGGKPKAAKPSSR